VKTFFAHLAAYLSEPCSAKEGGGPSTAAVRPGRSEMPWRDWASILFRVGNRIVRDNVSILAAGVAFYVFVAIPAALTVVVSIYGLFFGSRHIEGDLAPMAALLPVDVISIISDIVKSAAARPNAVLGAGLAVALFVALWSAQSATAALITALDIVYEESETRGFARFQATAVGMALGVISFAVVALSLIGLLPAALDSAPMSAADRIAVDIAHWILLVFLIVVAIGGIYRFAPDRDMRGERRGLLGILVATALCLLDSWLFSVYVADFASYDQRYGSLGAVIVLLLWLYLAVFAILVGAALNFEIEQHRTVT
jgi:membrane protein